MYTENYKTLLKEFRDRNKWKDTLCSWIGRLYCLNVPTTQNNLQIQCDPSLNPSDFFFFFTKIGKNPKIHMDLKGPRIAKTTLKMKET